MSQYMRPALVASVAINCIGIMLLGASGLLHPKLPPAPPTPALSSSNLHAVSVSMASAEALQGYTQDELGSDWGTPKHGSMAAGGSTSAVPSGSRGDGRHAESRTKSSGEANDAAQSSGAQSQSRAKADETESARARLASDKIEKLAERKGNPSQQPHMHDPNAANQTANATPSGNATHRSINRSQMHKDLMSKEAGANAQPTNIKMADSHPAHIGGGISPTMIHYPKMTLDLGTIHETRPAHGTTGGGYSDLRNVDITAHMVIDDPNNKPKTLIPDKIVHRFQFRCIPDPGNKSRCVAVGGNTRLGGFTLHGHDHITGVKYCVAGAGFIPGGGASNNQTEAKALGSGKDLGRANRDGKEGTQTEDGLPLQRGTISASGQPYEGQFASTAVRDMISTASSALHLPARPADNSGLTPGVRVPEPDRRIVQDPQPSDEPSPKDLKMAFNQSFTVRITSIGSVSKNGTVDWTTPQKESTGKRKYGGDGTGLLGRYYFGHNYNRFAFQHPDRNIDFDFIAKPPSKAMPPGTDFSVRWTGTLIPDHTDDYTIMAETDDGGRVFIDKQMIISDWSVHAAEEVTSTVHLEAGHSYAFRFDYMETDGGQSSAKLYWSGPATPLQYIPESVFRYPVQRQ